MQIQTEYVSQSELPGMVMDKVSRDEILTLIPDQTSLLAQMRDYCN
jgi:hypothetical protein